MFEKKINEKKRVAFLLIHYTLMIMFIIFALISFLSEVYELVLFNSGLGLVTYVESVKYLPKQYFETKETDS